MLTFLFWNVQKKPILHRVARICEAHAVDVVILAECEAKLSEVVASLNVDTANRYVAPNAIAQRTKIVFRHSEMVHVELFNDSADRLAVRRLSFDGRSPVLLGVVHLPSPVSWTLDDRAAFVQHVAEDLRRIEDLERNRRTVLVGDFNMSPFDNALVGAYSFHALMTRELAARKNNRLVQGIECRSFFNPMWQFLTDRNSRPAGTHYFESSTPINHFWHTYDQVLVRPELMDKLSKVEILDSDGVESFVKSDGRPDSGSSSSDHLPILFQLDL